MGLKTIKKWILKALRKVDQGNKPKIYPHRLSKLTLMHNLYSILKMMTVVVLKHRIIRLIKVNQIAGLFLISCQQMTKSLKNNIKNN